MYEQHEPGLAYCWVLLLLLRPAPHGLRSEDQGRAGDQGDAHRQQQALGLTGVGARGGEHPLGGVLLRRGLHHDGDGRRGRGRRGRHRRYRRRRRGRGVRRRRRGGGRRLHAALDLLLRELTGLGLGHRRDVVGVHHGDPLAVLEDDLVGRGGLDPRLRHLGVVARPLLVDPVGVLHLGLRGDRRRVAALARGVAPGRVGTLALEHLVQERRLERVVGPEELLRQRERTEAALVHERRVDVVLDARVRRRRVERERSEGVDQHVVRRHRGLGPRGAPGRWQVVRVRGRTDREGVAELGALLALLGGRGRDRAGSHTVEGVGPGDLLDADRLGLRLGRRARRRLGLRAARDVRLALAGVVRDDVRPVVGVREPARHDPVPGVVLDRVDRHGDGVVPRLESLVGTGGADVLADEDLLRLRVARGRRDLVGGGDRRLADDLGGRRRVVGGGLGLGLGRRLLLDGSDRSGDGLLGGDDLLRDGGGLDDLDGGDLVLDRGLGGHGHRGASHGEDAGDADGDDSHERAHRRTRPLLVSCRDDSHWGIPSVERTGLCSLEC